VLEQLVTANRLEAPREPGVGAITTAQFPGVLDWSGSRTLESSGFILSLPAVGVELGAVGRQAVR
jgi:hypothetical protein